jgi:hypothetical protein
VNRHHQVQDTLVGETGKIADASGTAIVNVDRSFELLMDPARAYVVKSKIGYIPCLYMRIIGEIRPSNATH